MMLWIVERFQFFRGNVADLITHIKQAKYNQNCARLLVEKHPTFRDWAITATFYSAIHYAEAAFTVASDIGHTEKAHGKEEQHTFRQRIILERAPHSAYKSYRKLREASSTVRYLQTDKPDVALDYYDDKAASEFLSRDLPAVRSGLATAFKVNLD